MAERVVSVRITALVGDYQKALGQAEQSTKKFGSTTLDMAQRNERHFNTLGLGAVAAGGAIAGGLGLAVKGAMDYESAFAGVSKTVDGTAAQMEQLSEGIRKMATELPASAVEIAGVAEAAGALGVKTGDILGFTKVMVDLGETTNLSSEEAATSMARFMNIMGTAGTDVDELGSTLVELGNNGASTEAEIMELALRLAGAGKQAGLSEADILGFANAMSSMGIEAEAGGSAFSKVFIGINDAVIDGGGKLETFAKVAGVSAEEFRAAYQDDAAGAIMSFVGGLGQIMESGQSTTAVLDELELGELRVSDALRRMAGSHELGTQSIDDSNRGWKENIALTAEAQKRYETSAARIEIAKNQLTDFGIEIGAVVLPAVASLAEAGGSLADTLSDLPGPAKVAAGVIGSLSGVALLAGGGLLLLLPRIANTKAALDTLGMSGTTAGRALGTLGKAAGIVGGIVGVALALDQLQKSMAAPAGTVNELSGGLVDLARGAMDAEPVVSLLGDDVDDFGRMIKAAGANKLNITDMIGVREIDTAKASMERLDSALAGLASSGHADIAAQAIDKLVEKYQLSAGQVENLKGRLPQYADALAGVATEQKLAGDTSFDLTGAMAELEEAAGEVAGTFDKLGLSLASASAGIDLRSSIDDLADVVDLSEEAAEAKKNQADAADGLAQAERSLADAQRSSEEAQAALTKARRDDAEAMEDLAFAAEGSVIGEERAAQRLKDAKREEERTRSFSPTSRKREDALLALREAELADRRARDSREDSDRALSEATALGPEGRVTGATRAVEDTGRGVTDAERAVAEARAAVGAATAEVLTAIQRQDELAGAVIDVVNAAKQEVEALVASGDIADTTEAKFAALRDRLGEVADKFPALRGSIEELAGIPITVDTSQAVVALDGLEARLRAIGKSGSDMGNRLRFRADGEKNVGLSPVMVGPASPSDPVVTGILGMGILGRAGGGRTRPNTTYVVGEEGPELWRQDSGGWVYPNQDPRTQMALGSPQAVPAGIMPVGGSDSGLAAAVRSLQDQVSRLGTTKTTNWNIGEVRAQDYDDFVRQAQQRERMANLAGG